MKALILMVLWGSVVIYPTIEGTNIRDYSEPAVVIESDGTGYQTIPGTDIRDYEQPGFVVERDYADPAFDADYYPGLRWEDE